MTTEDRTPLIILGRVVGTHTGWDQVSDSGLLFYGFEPDDAVDLPPGDLFFDYHAGTYAVHDDEGAVVFGGDIVVPLATLGRAA